jgi:hypothetical protein
MKITKYLLIGLITLFFSNCSYSQNNVKNPFENTKDSLGRIFLGKDFAKTELEKFINDPKSNISKGRILITNKEMLISIAEPILFEIYGKEDIIDERPYEIYLFDDYWYMTGTLPKNMKGGTFSIVINRKTCEVVGISHGK